MISTLLNRSRVEPDWRELAAAGQPNPADLFSRDFPL